VNPSLRCAWIAITAALAHTSCGWRSPATAPAPSLSLHGALIDPDTLAANSSLIAKEYDTIVVLLRDEHPDARIAAAATAVRAAGRRLGYWFEIGRNEALANAHPEWVATLQGHDEWRRDRTESPSPTPAESSVVMAWPWVPVLYEEAFAAHRERVRTRLHALPAADFVFLNDLQGPPAACGCGNLLCRWATDYTLHGRPPVRGATPLGADAAARFVREVQAMAATSRVIPVWVTECEEADTTADGACHGVGCYHGACWREFDKQWAPLRAASEQVALLLPYRTFRRDLPRFGATAGWVRFAIEHLRTREQKLHRRELPGEALIAVVQGWNVDDDVQAQTHQAQLAGVTSVLVAHTAIEQSFVPRLRRQR